MSNFGEFKGQEGAAGVKVKRSVVKSCHFGVEIYRLGHNRTQTENIGWIQWGHGGDRLGNDEDKFGVSTSITTQIV